jgi:hypothetical protein
VTHERRLRDADDVVRDFLARALQLGSKLGPILLQMRPDFAPDELPAIEKACTTGCVIRALIDESGLSGCRNARRRMAATRDSSSRIRNYQFLTYDRCGAASLPAVAMGGRESLSAQLLPTGGTLRGLL